jgi:hypothetical protein
MKRGTRPTRAQKIFITGNRLSPANWLVTGENKELITIIHKRTETMRTIKKNL